MAYSHGFSGLGKRTSTAGLGGQGLGGPGLGGPGLGEPGLGEPGLGEPGLGGPGLGEPGLGEPGPAGRRRCRYKPARVLDRPRTPVGQMSVTPGGAATRRSERVLAR